MGFCLLLLWLLSALGSSTSYSEKSSSDFLHDSLKSQSIICPCATIGLQIPRPTFSPLQLPWYIGGICTPWVCIPFVGLDKLSCTDLLLLDRFIALLPACTKWLLEFPLNRTGGLLQLQQHLNSSSDSFLHRKYLIWDIRILQLHLTSRLCTTNSELFAFLSP